MKLLKKTGSYYRQFLLIILVIISFMLYLFFVFTTHQELDEDLLEARVLNLNQDQTYPDKPMVLELVNEKISIAPANQMSDKFYFSDTIIASADDSEMEPYRMLTYHELNQNRPYKIRIFKSKFERKDLLAYIAIILCTLMVLIFSSIYFFNKYISQKLWAPFYETLRRLQNFNMTHPEPIIAIPTDVDEFEQLASGIEKMTGQIQKDFSALKEFTSNASHEIQTPLTIMQNKIELLLQSGHLQHSDLTLLNEIKIAAERLSSLTRSLLLLSRIENTAPGNAHPLNLMQCIEERIEDFEPIIEDKNLKIHLDLKDISKDISNEMFDIILNNLLINAIRYNVEGGTIEIFLTEETLEIINEGEPPMKSVLLMTDRFQKGDDSSDSFGLGLAIVKEICKKYDFVFNYVFEENRHKAKIHF